MPTLPPDLVQAYLIPIAAAVAAGGLIGLEREWRGHPAGLRTHILVCLASTLLMLGAVHQVGWMTGTPEAAIRIDPVRMAHGVLTGVGFLCGGVIFRQGLSVHGLTTAASLWITSALGVLFGAGMLALGAAGATIVLAVLVGLRWVDAILPGDRVMEVLVAFRRGGEPTAPAFRALLAEFGVRPGRLSHALCDDSETVELGARLRLRGEVDGQMLAERLLADTRVVRFKITPRND